MKKLKTLYFAILSTCNQFEYKSYKCNLSVVRKQIISILSTDIEEVILSVLTNEFARYHKKQHLHFSNFPPEIKYPLCVNVLLIIIVDIQLNIVKKQNKNHTHTE